LYSYLCSLLLVLALGGYEQPSQAGERVRVAVFDNPPLLTLAAPSDAPGGIFMDVLRYTADREGWSLEYVPGNFAQGVERLKAGEVDLLPGLPDSPERDGVMAFSREPVLTSWGRIYVRPASKIVGMRDLAGKRVAVVQGSVLERSLLENTTRYGAPAIPVQFPEFRAAFRAVSDGRADAVLANRFSGTVYARAAKLRGTAVVLSPYGFRFAASRQGRTALLRPIDRSLLELKADSESIYYDDVRLLEDGTREFAIPTWLPWAASAGAVLLLIAVGWAIASRRAARRIASIAAQAAASEREQRHLNEELRRIGDNSLDLIAVLDSESQVLRVSRAAYSLLGRQPQDLLGRSCLEWLLPQHREAGRRSLERVRAGESMYAAPSRILRPDGTTRRLIWSLVWSDQEQEMYAIGHDDSERHELVLSLKDRSDKLQLANEDLRTFAQAVSHDLRSPVATVVGFVGKVLRDAGHQLPDRSHNLLSRAHAAAQRMDSMIVNLLRFAHASESGVLRTLCDVSSLCEEIALDLAGESAHVQIHIQRGMKAFADRELLRHVLENLLSNAWKFSGGHSRAHITVGCSDDGDPVYFVEDNGAGFDMAFAEKLFVPFARLHSEQDFAGTGIGLSIAHRIVVGHGGRLWAQSSPGQGALFRFTLGQESRPQDLLHIRDSAALPG
jgi:PAS domain S-box-containing protein